MPAQPRNDSAISTAKLWLGACLAVVYIGAGAAGLAYLTTLLR
jgi:hypothetical protein